MGRCKDERPGPGVREEEQKVGGDNNLFDDLPNGTKAAVTILAGCAEGDRLTFSVGQSDMALMRYGTVKQLTQYALGQQVDVEGRSYQRGQIPRKQVTAQQRVEAEMKTGEYTFSVAHRTDGSPTTLRVTPGSTVAQYFSMMAARNVGRGRRKRSIPAHVGGVEVVVSSVIKPGSVDAMVDKTAGQYTARPVEKRYHA